MTKPRIRILCVDDHQLIREGVALIIEREPDMRVVAAARTGEEAVTLFREHRPDVTLMDLQLPVMNGLEAIQAIRKEDPAARIIVLTMYEGNEHIYRALTAGAATYLLKDTLSSDLIRVVRQVHAGEKPLRPEVQAKLAERAAQPTLTPREVEVIELVGEGRRNKEVAATLHISEETVQVHLRNIFAKLQVSDRAAALTVATKRGIVRPR
jgi:DNA-binding NarL/FixJ family response regulator